MAVTRYAWAVYGTVAATGKSLGQPTYGTIYMRDHEGFKRSRLDGYMYSDDPELAVPIQSSALEAVVIAHKWYRKLKLLNFVTFTVGTESPRAAPTHHYGSLQGL